jgi:hypothetical protein
MDHSVWFKNWNSAKCYISRFNSETQVTPIAANVIHKIRTNKIAMLLIETSQIYSELNNKVIFSTKYYKIAVIALLHCRVLLLNRVYITRVS